jgi:alpha-L-fucosidase
MKAIKLKKEAIINKLKVIWVIAIAICTISTYAQLPTEDPPQGTLHPLLSEVIKAGPYAPQWEYLVKHPIPAWFAEDKIGLSAHWGPYAVPGWTPRKDTPYGVAYAEWYWQWLKSNDAVKAYHKEHYGDAHYDDFIDGTKNLITGETEGFFAENFDADQWMQIFKNAGVRYFFITSKHHDGFCIWDSKYTNRNSMKMGPKRDLFGEMVTAARKHDIKIGLYYSYYEWNNPFYRDNDDISDYKGCKMLNDEDKDGLSNEYVDDYMIPQIKELIDKYQPDYLCFDGEWDHPYPYWRSRQLIAYYYNQAAARGQEVLINDRFGSKMDGFSGTRGVYGDFKHVEYYADVDRTQPWAMWRGFGNSYGYNRNEHPDNILTPKEVIEMVIDCISHNGNIEFNIGPKADGTISEIDLERLAVMEKWLKVNGEAIYGTQAIEPYQDNRARLTKKEETVYAIYLADENETIPPAKICFTAFQPESDAEISMLGVTGNLNWEKVGNGFVVEIPESAQKNPPCEFAWVLKFQN